MRTEIEVAASEGQTHQPVEDAASTQGVEPQRSPTKAGIGGCLLYPLFFLGAQPFLFVYMLLNSRKIPGPFVVTYRIYGPYLIYDLALLSAVGILLLLFVRKKAILPALFVFFLVSFSILSGLLVNALWRLPGARVVEAAIGNPLWSHFVMLFQSLLLIPYFALDGRVRNTFIRALDERNLLERLVKPIANPAERLYGWLARSGKRVFIYAFAFVVCMFFFDWVVDAIVLSLFLS